MGAEFNRPSIHNDGERADNVTRDGDLEAYDFDWKIGEVLLLAFPDHEAKTTGMTTTQNTGQLYALLFS